MIIVIDKQTEKVFGYYNNIGTAYEKLAQYNKTEDDVYITEEISMKYISRITFCIR